MKRNRWMNNARLINAGINECRKDKDGITEGARKTRVQEGCRDGGMDWCIHAYMNDGMNERTKMND